MKHADIIDTLGAVEIANRLKVELAHVRVWKNRGIPRSRFAFLINEFSPDITLAMLTDDESASRNKASA